MTDDIELLKKMLAPFKAQYDKYVKVANGMNISLDDAIKMKEEIDVKSFEKNLIEDATFEERKFWIECDMDAYFELMCVKLIKDALEKNKD